MMTVEALYEDHVLKPLGDLTGLSEHERVWVVVCSRPRRDALRQLVGSLSPQEATAMRNTMEREFERVEGDW